MVNVSSATVQWVKCEVNCRGDSHLKQVMASITSRPDAIYRLKNAESFSAYSFGASIGSQWP